MYRASDAIDLNPWAVQGHLHSRPSVNGQMVVNGPAAGPSSQQISREAADRSAILQALKDRVPARPNKLGKPGKQHRSLLARLRHITLAKSPA